MPNCPVCGGDLFAGKCLKCGAVLDEWVVRAKKAESMIKCHHCRSPIFVDAFGNYVCTRCYAWCGYLFPQGKHSAGRVSAWVAILLFAGLICCLAIIALALCGITL